MLNLIYNDSHENPFRFLLDAIPTGEENAVSMSALAELFHTTERGIRKLVHLAREDGCIVAGNASGYFLPEELEELRGYCSFAKSRVRSEYKALKPALDVLKELDEEEARSGQASLFVKEDGEEVKTWDSSFLKP